MSFARAASRGRSAARARSRRRWLWLTPAALVASTFGQTQQPPYDPGFLMRSSPTTTYYDPPRRDYNLKWGPVSGRLYGSIQTEFSDNINLVERGAESDIYFFPNVGIGFQWPISPMNLLEFSLGVGYRAYVNNPELNSLTISPDSRLNYRMRAGKVGLIFHDSFQVQVDPLSRPDVTGAPTGEILNFKRFNNDIGVQAEWQARSNVAIVSSYDYMIDRSLNSEFTFLDRDDHTLALGWYSNVGSGWTIGMNGAVTVTDYLLPIQNDGISYSIGPNATVKLTRFITAEASVAYTISDFEESGLIGDRSDFSGISFAFGIKHNMNSRTSHNLRVAHTISPGLGSNFYELTVAQYGLNWKMNSYLTLTSTFSYEYFNASGVSGEQADRYLVYLGTGWQVARRWSLGLGYSFAWRDSDHAFRDYQQNRVTLDLTHDF